jgi:hypothetical protein
VEENDPTIPLWPALGKPTGTPPCAAALVGTIKTGILNDLVTLALATEMDKFIPDADHINALPGPLRKYIQDLETRVDHLVMWRRSHC